MNLDTFRKKIEKGTVRCKRILHPNTTPKVLLSHPEGVYDKLRLGGTRTKKVVTKLSKTLSAIDRHDRTYRQEYKTVTPQFLKKMITAKPSVVPDAIFRNNISQTQRGGSISALDGPAFFNEQEPMVWGLGVEHEMQLFHLGRSSHTVGSKILLHPNTTAKDQTQYNYSKANIIFDSQESTCFISGDDDKQGACRKKRGNRPYYTPPASLRKTIFKKQDLLTNEEQQFLEHLDWELSGRYIDGCEPDPFVVERVPVLMPELVTSHFQDRTLQSIAEETLFLEEMFIKCQMKNPFTREKVATYGPLVTHKCGALANIQVPVRPTYTSPYYELIDDHWKDYVGSYHITLTLPHRPDITDNEFVTLHQRAANQIQWIEPLLMTAFFTGDPDPMAQLKGSFRVGAVGWGNFGGSNVRKFATGLTRGSNIQSHWRTHLNLPETEKLDACTKMAPAVYKKSVSSLPGDFRTFGEEPNKKKCKALYNPSDCPKADGAPMRPPFGMEIRIFDHFHAEYLVDLLKIIALVSANSKRHPATLHVYKHKAWIRAMHAIMKQGWNAMLPKAYVQVLRSQLGIPVSHGRAYEVFQGIVSALHELNSKEQIVQLMDETSFEPPRLPEVNRECWELSFTTGGYMNLLKAWLRILPAKRYPVGAFQELLFGHPKSPFSRARWGHQFEAICYAMESRGLAQLTFDAERQMTHIKISANS